MRLDGIVRRGARRGHLATSVLTAWAVASSCNGAATSSRGAGADAAHEADGSTDGGRPGDSDASPGACPTPPALRFRKVILHRQFVCEGAAIGDFNGDGAMDVAAGPEWYPGPELSVAQPLWPRVTFDPKGYSDCFFQFPYDFNGDGRMDILVIGFPGTAAVWFENPPERVATWRSHEVFAAVDGESPAFTDLTGDGRPELVFMNGGRLGWAAPPVGAPEAAWPFHPLSADRGYGTFSHGLGLGDLDGDGRTDVIEATGLFVQPSSLVGDPPWPRHEQRFGSGGAQIFAGDWDGDGDADVVTTLAAHGYGLGWYERTSRAGATPLFSEHVLVPNMPPAAGAAVVLHEPHALAVADVDGDGVADLITGERFWGHVPEGTPDFNAPARLYWFRHTPRGASDPCFVPTLIDDDSGVGTQLTAGDVNGDGRIDIVVANKKGAFVFIQESARAE